MLLYINDYNEKEASVIRRMGIPTCRHHLGVDDLILPDSSATQAIVRAPRLSLEQYDQLWNECTSVGLTPVSTPKSYAIGASIAAQTQLLGDLSPKTLVLPRHGSVEFILSELTRASMKLPVFVRSELESAAKYVGIGGCTIETMSTKDIARVVSNLDANVPAHDHRVFKEMKEIAVVGTSGQRLEYRAIVVAGALWMFDAFDSALPQPRESGVDLVIEKAASALYAGGCTGGLFIDAAVTAKGDVIIVECKNLTNGTIKSVEAFGAAAQSRLLARR